MSKHHTPAFKEKKNAEGGAACSPVDDGGAVTALVAEVLVVVRKVEERLLKLSPLAHLLVHRLVQAVHDHLTPTDQ